MGNDSTRTIAPHPVAALLTDEQKARVRAAAFIKTRMGISAPEQDCCPLGVAIGRSYSPGAGEFIHQVGRPLTDEEKAAVNDFMLWADSRCANPADVYALLGCAQEPRP